MNTENQRKVSIILPVYNEEAFLSKTITHMVQELSNQEIDQYEIIISENGSTDTSRQIARALSEKYDKVRVHVLDAPSYGKSLKEGIRAARYEHIVIFNVDFWDMKFFAQAVEALAHYDGIIGSKCLKPGHDHRPLVRRMVTTGFNVFLRIVFGFHGTDTHGIKAFRRSAIVALVGECVTDKEVFDTELILRAQRAGLRLKELPVSVEETRPTRYSLFSRIPRTARDMGILFYILKIKPLFKL